MPVEWWGPATSQLWQVTLLIPAAILIVRWLGRGRSHLAYGLLVVVLLKCVTPPLWSSRTGLFSWASRLIAAEPEESATLRLVGPRSAPETIVPNAYKQLPARSETDSDQTEARGEVPTARPAPGATVRRTKRKLEKTETTAAPPVSPIDWKWLAGLACSSIWLLGTCVVAGVLLRGVWQLRDWCRSAVPADAATQKQAGRLARQMGLPSIPEVLVTDEAVMPAAAGVWREVVLLPRHLIDSVSPAEFELVLAHELNHFRRWDTVIGSLQAAAQVVWWFHPLVWWLNRELRRYREQCCDEEVLARVDCRPPEYARCLLNVLELNERFSPALGLAGMSPFEMTSQRLRNIMRSRAGFAAGMPRWCWLVLVAAALVVLPGAGLTIDASALPRMEGTFPRVDRREDPDPTEEPVTTAGDADNAAEQPAAGPDGGGVAVLDDLRYRWKQGDQSAWRVSIEVDLGGEIDAYSGTVSLSVRSVDDHGAELALGGTGLTSFRRPKPGRMPRPGAFSMARFPSPPSFEFPGERLVRVDALGRILAERGDIQSLPGLLGSWPAYILQPLPGQVAAQWSAQSTETVSFDADQFREATFEPWFRRGPYRREPATETLRARLEADYEIAEAGEDSFVVIKHYTLATVEQVNSRPRAEMSGDKSVTYDIERGLPVSVAENSQLVVREGNVATTYPITVHCELLQPSAEVPTTAKPSQTDETSAPVTYDGPAPVPSSELPVTAETAVESGDVVQVEWSGQWYPADVLDVAEDGRLRIHFRGFSDRWDTAVPRSRVQLPGPEYAAEQTQPAVNPGE